MKWFQMFWWNTALHSVRKATFFIVLIVCVGNHTRFRGSMRWSARKPSQTCHEQGIIVSSLLGIFYPRSLLVVVFSYPFVLPFRIVWLFISSPNKGYNFWGDSFLYLGACLHLYPIGYCIILFIGSSACWLSSLLFVDSVVVTHSCSSVLELYFLSVCHHLSSLLLHTWL